MAFRRPGIRFAQPQVLSALGVVPLSGTSRRRESFVAGRIARALIEYDHSIDTAFARAELGKYARNVTRGRRTPQESVADLMGRRPRKERHDD